MTGPVLIFGGLARDLATNPNFWIGYILWAGAASFILFALYGWDKTMAKRGGTRVPESALHFLALTGGFVGGFLGRKIFRNKTKKTQFLILLILATLIHGAIIAYLQWVRAEG